MDIITGTYGSAGSAQLAGEREWVCWIVVPKQDDEQWGGRGVGCRVSGVWLVSGSRRWTPLPRHHALGAARHSQGPAQHQWVMPLAWHGWRWLASALPLSSQRSLSLALSLCGCPSLPGESSTARAAAASYTPSSDKLYAQAYWHYRTAPASLRCSW